MSFFLKFLGVLAVLIYVAADVIRDTTVGSYGTGIVIFATGYPILSCFGAALMPEIAYICAKEL